MKNTILFFFRHLQYKIMGYINEKIHNNSLFKDDVWEIRFSKNQRLSYIPKKSLFTFSIKSSDDIFKYLFLILMAAMLVVMPLMSKEVGISTREIAQNRYTALIYNHFHDIGDADAYKTHPYAATQAQYIDLLIYSVCKSLHVEDVFLIKHIISSIFGWLIILYLSILILRAFNWRAAFITAFFLFISPRFIGYSLGNVVDVTFTFGFIFTIMQMYSFCRELPTIRIFRIVKILIGILIALSCYNAGFVLIHFLIIFTLLNFFLYNPIKQFFTKAYLRALGELSLFLIGTSIAVYSIHAIGTWFLTDSVVSPNNAFALLTNNYPAARSQLFSNHIIGPDDFPYSYLSKYLFITIPTIILIGFLMFFIFIKNAFKTLRPYSVFIFLYAFFYCIGKVRTHYMNTDTVWAIYYIIYPLFMLIAASGIECTFRSINDKYTNSVVFCIIALLSFMPIRHITTNHPMTVMYFNELSGGLHNAYSKYELDCNEQINKSACAWLSKYIQKSDFRCQQDSTNIIVCTNGNTACGYFFKQNDRHLKTLYKAYQPQDSTWDYYLSFCNDIPTKDFRKGTWPPDSNLNCFYIEKIPIVTFIRNDKRLRAAFVQDSMAKAQQAIADSIDKLQTQQ